jgi:CheY-like chemotaxis protein
MIGRRRATILVIDDDPGFLHQAEASLSARGYDVLLALTGQQAFLLLERLGQQIDLALIDLVMPAPSGMEIIHRLREEWPGLTTIATTRTVSAASLEVVKLLGAADALEKPITAEWLTAIDRLLQPVRRFSATE